MNLTADSKVGLIATEHPLATRVFARHGIDFCCGGGRRLQDACRIKAVELERVISELETEIDSGPSSMERWDQRPLGELIDHILSAYHEPLKEELPRLAAMARKVNEVHGEKQPEMLQGILDTILALKADLEPHMIKEEQVLFPMIRAGQGHAAGGPISVMEMEHDEVGRMLARLRELSCDYQVPEAACNTWRALWHGLADLERVTHEHIHLENNILHVRALRQQGSQEDREIPGESHRI